MMGEVRRYILSVVCTAILCAIVQLFFEKDARISATVKLVTGLVLTIAVISPLLKEDILDLDTYFSSISHEGSAASEEGETAARNSIGEIITQKTQSYILEKADALGAEIQVEICLDAQTPPVPVSVTLSGTVSPYIKKQLATFIQTELGISEENQIWI